MFTFSYVRRERGQFGPDENAHRIWLELDNTDANAGEVIQYFFQFMLGVGYHPSSILGAFEWAVEEYANMKGKD